MIQPVQDRIICGTITQGSASAQPWAERFNPVGIDGAAPKTATGTGALPSQVPAVRPVAVCGERTEQRAFEFLATDGHGWNTDFSKPVRADIFVASPATNGQSSVRSDIIGMWTEYAAPNGAEIYFGFGSTNMPRLTALGTARRRKRQLGRARSPAMSQLVVVRKHRPMAVWSGRTRQILFCTRWFH
jgi:hypothetical protein